MNRERRIVEGAAALARDRASIERTVRTYDEHNIQIEIARRTRIAEARFTAEIQRPIDHLDDRNFNRWFMERNRIEQQVRRDYHESGRALSRRVALHNRH